MAQDEEFLFYPLDTGEDPACPACGQAMMFGAQEARDGKPDFMTFRCEHCGRTEKFISDD